MTKVLIVATSTCQFKNGNETGLWLSELVHFYDAIKKKVDYIDIASIEGGKIPIDPLSLSKPLLDKTTKSYYKNNGFMSQLEHSHGLKELYHKDYDVIYFAGGHGAMYDFKDNKEIIAFSEDIYARGGIVSAVCHGSSALLNLKDDLGEYIIKGKMITGYSNTEERAIKKFNDVPYSLQNELRSRGAFYKKAIIPFNPYVVRDGSLGCIITGQNPFSTKKVAQTVCHVLFNE